MLKKIMLCALGATALGNSLHAQLETRKSVLISGGEALLSAQAANRAHALELAPVKGWPITTRDRNGDMANLVGVDLLGLPIYLSTQSNVVAANTVGTNQLWTGGTSGLNLTGSSAAMADRVAIWDGGRVRVDHQELNGRITHQDAAQDGLSDHSTHVAGTIMATGVNAQAKGMAFALPSVKSWDYYGDVGEMFPAAASGIILSNHSYGARSGWSFNGTNNRWEWLGAFGDTADYKFGYYDQSAQVWDSLAYNAPNYLIVKSAGNNRGETGPAVGTPYWGFDANGNLVNLGNRPGNISNNDQYDCISTTGTAKNILTVGAVNGINGGWQQATDVVMSSFSSWGPTDDGRIKPDVVADGVNLFSCTMTSTTSYGTMSGTSMASPSATGSLALLQEYWQQRHSGNFMRSATLKALAIHTVNEAGTANGPDYRFGWGLLNVARAADVIRNDGVANHMIMERNLANGSSFSTNVTASGPLTVTLVWTDPKGNVSSSNILNNTAKKLVNDLDLRITDGTNTFLPWKLDPLTPWNNATQADNSTDNVEKINAYSTVGGQTYTITVSHKGTLARGQQAYSLIISGVAVSPIDMALEDITVPGASTCPGPSLATIKVKNIGSTDRTALPVRLEARNGTTVLATYNAVIPGTIPAGNTRTYSFQTPINFPGSASITLTASVTDPADPNRPNDTLVKTITMPAAATAPTGSGQICGNQAILSVDNPQSLEYYYYETPVSTANLGKGLRIVTPVVTANRTYYISEGGSGNVGLTAKTNFPNGGSYLSNVAHYIKYNATSNVVLESARMYTKYWGQVQITVGNLLTDDGAGNFTYTTLSSSVIDVYPTSPNIASGTQNVYEAADTGARFYIGMPLPSGNHIIVIKPLNNANLFASNNLTGNPYPFSISGLIDLTGNSGGSAFQNNYYYLYDMNVRTATCPSARGTIVATVAPTPTITQNGTVLNSGVTAGTIKWFRNGTQISGASGVTYNATQSGTYKVTVEDPVTLCLLSSADYNYVVTAVGNVPDPVFALQVAPNPARDQFVIRYHTDRREDVTIQVVNAQGQQVISRLNRNVMGNASETINISNQASGVYMIKVIHGDKVEYRKLLID